MLDMDGTILDLAYDNYMWMRHVPERFAQENGITVNEARTDLLARFGAAQGDLSWYCLDHWSERLGLDVLQLHRDNHHRIDYLPGAQRFLEQVREHPIQVLLVTNSHPDTLQLKHEVTGLGEYFDGIYSSHRYGFAKERQEFWHALHDEVGFDPQATMFVDDSQPVLRSAGVYGFTKLVAVTRPDTTEPARDRSEFVDIEGVSDLI